MTGSDLFLFLFLIFFGGGGGGWGVHIGYIIIYIIMNVGIIYCH